MEKRLVTVTAGIIHHDGKILIAERRKDKSLGGLWEFPGGKIEQGETCEQTLKREIKEEFDISVEVGDYITEILHEYPDFWLKMYVYDAKWNGNGEIHICDHEQYKFVTPAEFKNYEFPAADVDLLEFLQTHKSKL